MKKAVQILAFGAVVAAIVGCGGGAQGGSAGGGGAQGGSTPTASSSTDADYAPKNVDAGLSVSFSKDMKPWMARVASSSKYGVRSDPFALTSEEMAYDRQQNAERVMGEMGGMVDLHQEKEENVEPPVEEEQPYRRLAGVIVGDSVLALIDMGNGQLEVIRPGEKITGTDWTVVSIDQDKAILHRDGNIAPHTVSVRLEEPPFGVSSGSTGFGGGPTGPNQFGPGQGPNGAGMGGGKPRLNPNGGK